MCVCSMAFSSGYFQASLSPFSFKLFKHSVVVFFFTGSPLVSNVLYMKAVDYTKNNSQRSHILFTTIYFTVATPLKMYTLKTFCIMCCKRPWRYPASQVWSNSFWETFATVMMNWMVRGQLPIYQPRSNTPHMWHTQEKKLFLIWRSCFMRHP